MNRVKLSGSSLYLVIILIPASPCNASRTLPPQGRGLVPQDRRRICNWPRRISTIDPKVRVRRGRLLERSRRMLACSHAAARSAPRRLAPVKEVPMTNPLRWRSEGFGPCNRPGRAPPTSTRRRIDRKHLPESRRHLTSRRGSDASGLGASLSMSNPAERRVAGVAKNGLEGGRAAPAARRDGS